MAFGNIDATATGNYSGWNPSAYLEEGARFQLGRTIVQPYGALRYIYVRQNAFTETGAGSLDQSVGGINTHALRGLLESRLAQAWRTPSGTTFVPELRAAWMHEFLEPSSTLNAVFAPIGGGRFAAQGLNFGRDWALLGGGTQYVMKSERQPVRQPRPAIQRPPGLERRLRRRAVRLVRDDSHSGPEKAQPRCQECRHCIKMPK